MGRLRERLQPVTGALWASPRHPAAMRSDGVGSNGPPEEIRSPSPLQSLSRECGKIWLSENKRVYCRAPAPIREQL